MNTAITSNSPPGDHEQLQHAFAVFSHASQQLSGAYQELQQQVAQLTRELAVANGELRRSQRLAVMGEMAAGLAHQLRTPLSTALLYTAHLANPALAGDERSGFAEKALERLRHLENLIRDMLLFVKGETAEWETVAISSLLAQLKQVIEPQMARRSLHFLVHDESAGASLMADRKALSGAVACLLENAMQASPEGGRVTLECIQAGDAIVLKVRDDGRGIAAEIQERLFEPFFTTRDEGTGLGLAIVRGVTQSLGGTVQVRSAPGAGSEFILRLPRKLTRDS
jgi:two-component system sensor histidine kinase FlrB